MKVIKQYPVQGMSCASCASSIQSYLRHQPGILKADVNYAGHEISVAYDDDQTNDQEIARNVEALGYQLLLDADDKDVDELEQKESKKLRTQLIISASATLPLFISSMFLMHWIPEAWLRW